MQKSFEGVLRSLITQLLKPYRTAFQKQYQKTWERFQPLDQKKTSFRYQIDTIIKTKKISGSKKDLKEQLQRAMDNSGKITKRSQTVEDLDRRLSEVRRKWEEMNKQNPELGKSDFELQLKLNQLREDIAAVS